MYIFGFLSALEVRFSRLVMCSFVVLKKVLVLEDQFTSPCLCPCPLTSSPCPCPCPRTTSPKSLSSNPKSLSLSSSPFQHHWLRVANTWIIVTDVSGKLCADDIDECLLYPTRCRNGATCQNTNGSYVCDCPRGYQGRHCESNPNDCLPGLCSFCTTFLLT